MHSRQVKCIQVQNACLCASTSVLWGVCVGVCALVGVQHDFKYLCLSLAASLEFV